MKDYASITDNYLRANGLKKVKIKNSVGELQTSLKTDKQIREMKLRGITIHE
jgi:hypothetical protein